MTHVRPRPPPPAFCASVFLCCDTARQRSFGVKAEMVDFEVTTPAGARQLATSHVPEEQERHEQRQKRKTANYPQQSPSKRTRKAPLGLIQQSIRSFLPSSRTISRRRSLGGENSGVEGGDAPRSSVAGATGVRGLARRAGATSTNARLERGQALGDEGRAGLCTGNSGRNSAPVVPSIENTGRSPSLPLAGGTSNGAVGRPSNNARFPLGRGTRYGRRGKGRGRAGRGGTGEGNGNGNGADAKDAGNGMGQAIADWAWDYFCTPWDTAGEELSSCTPGALVGPVQPRQPQAPVVSDAGTTNRSTTINTDNQRRLQVPTADLSSGTAALPRANSDATADRLPKYGQTSLPGGSDSSGHGQAGATEAQSAESRSASYDAPEARRPPPLYFQHDGHSRSVIGVVCGGDASRKSGGGVVDRGVEGGGGDRGPGSLLVFDPSHAGKDVCEALDNNQNMRWGR